MKTIIPEVILCKPKIYWDGRGYFMETFRVKKFEDFLGYKINFCQDNEQYSKKGVLRGLHYQLDPYSQSKLIRVVSGQILSVAVDLRESSSTFGKFVSQALDDIYKNIMFIPKGFAHGYITLSDNTIVEYKVDEYYHKNAMRGLAFDDIRLGIDWIIKNDKIILSEKDKSHPGLSNIESYKGN